MNLDPSRFSSRYIVRRLGKADVKETAAFIAAQIINKPQGCIEGPAGPSIFIPQGRVCRPEGLYPAAACGR